MRLNYKFNIQVMVLYVFYSDKLKMGCKKEINENIHSILEDSCSVLVKPGKVVLLIVKQILLFQGALQSAVP